MKKGRRIRLPFSFLLFSAPLLLYSPMGTEHLLISPLQFQLTLDRLAHQLVEEHGQFENSALIGIQPRGIQVAAQLRDRIQAILGGDPPRCGDLDITFFRDDFRRQDKPLQAAETNLDFTVEDLRVVLVDDVLFTGRTIRAAMDALLAHGRPATVELAVLVDRRFRRELPIEPKYVGRSVDSLDSQRVKVIWAEQEGAGENRVELINPDPQDG